MPTTMIRNLVFTIAFLFLGSRQEIYSQEIYPVPIMNDKLLFYFQRSSNKNTIIYELNTLPNGSINAGKPVNEYWIRYEEGGVKKELSFIQRKAFGVQGQLFDKSNESYILHFNCYKKRDIYLRKTENKYKTFITINGEPAELTKLFIKCENNALGFPLIIKFIEITGMNLKNKNMVVEKLIP